MHWGNCRSGFQSASGPDLRQSRPVLSRADGEELIPQLGLPHRHHVTIAKEHVESSRMPLRVVDGIVGIDERLPRAARRGDAGIGASWYAAVVPNIHHIRAAVAMVDVSQFLAAR